jgi:hypothetical protein
MAVGDSARYDLLDRRIVFFGYVPTFWKNVFAFIVAPPVCLLLQYYALWCGHELNGQRTTCPHALFLPLGTEEETDEGRN